MNKLDVAKIERDYAKIILALLVDCTTEELAVVLNKDINRADMLEGEQYAIDAALDNMTDRGGL